MRSFRLGFSCGAAFGRHFLGWTMAAQEATPDSQSGESCALDLPSACDLRDYVLQRPSQEANSEALSSVEAHSFPYSSDVDPVPLVLLIMTYTAEFGFTVL
ncbi:shieldin complex subunit 1 isoform X3 [Perognathus longimembris pacificus]|uniref:shieldin complex subunit 1 isoform X3 n=1 Tax=Perognathus longimembris pacificus TaxID=214514 RepID=UPI0020187A06|nr:shieldin complex subunit 1 isoform X3 [Perognathus longimembris pacificus]